MIKISFPSKDFSQALAVLGKQTARKSLLPILQDVLLRFNEERHVFQMMASDSEAWLTLDAPFISLLERKDPSPAVVLPLSMLKEMFALLPAVFCTAVISDGKISVSHECGKFSLPVRDSEEFPMPLPVATPSTPLPRSFEPVCRFSMDSSWLLKSIADAHTCVANDLLRPQMNAVCMEVFADKLVVVSSNGQTLYKNQIDMGAGGDYLEYRQFEADKSARLLVPRNVLDTIVSAFSSAESVTVTADEKRIQFQAEGIDLVCRAEEGNYPNYDSVIPRKSPYVVKVSRASLRAALRRLGIFASESGLAVISRKGDQLVLRADDIEFSTEGNELVPILSGMELPENQSTGMKIPVMLSMLNIVGTQNVELHMDEPQRAVLLREDCDNSQLTLLVMPMIINP